MHRSFRSPVSLSRIVPTGIHAIRPRHLRWKGRFIQQHLKFLSTPPPKINASPLSMEQYQRLSDQTMNMMVEDLEDLLDSAGNPSYEVEYHDGVLTLRLGDNGTYVINKQPPNKQIWLSSPISGPKRYDYLTSDNSWRYSRDGTSLDSLLNEELGALLRQNVQVLRKGSVPS